MSSPYYLAIDIRDATTTAVVAEGPRLDAIRTRPFRPESGYAWPTAVYISTDEILFADDALADGHVDPARLIQDFVAGVGDPSAVYTIDDVQFTATDLYAWTVDDIAGRVAAVRHAEPTGVWAVIPAWWSDERVDALAAALDRDGRTEVDFITAPEALASRYLLTDPANTDLTVIVCDVDEHALQAAIVRQVPDTRSRQISPPIHSLISPAWARDDAMDEHAVDLLALAVSEAGVDIDAVDAIVLAGFSERVADFGRLLAARFGDPIDTDPHPDWATAAGAAIALAREEIAARPAAAATTGAAIASPTFARAAPAWYRRPARLATIGVGAAALVSVVVVASAFAIGGIAPSETETETDPPVSEISPTDERASTGVPSASPSPSATPLPTTDAAVPPTITEPSVPETPTVPVSRRPNSSAPVAPVPSTPVIAPAPTTPDPPASAPPVDSSDPTATPTPTAPVPDPTVDPEPTVEPTPSPEPSAPEPDPSPLPDESVAP